MTETTTVLKSENITMLSSHKDTTSLEASDARLPVKDWNGAIRCPTYGVDLDGKVYHYFGSELKDGEVASWKFRASDGTWLLIFND